MLHLLLRSLSLSVHHVCRDDDDEFALLDAHDVPTRTRGKEGGGVLSLPTPPLLPPQLRQRKCIRNQTLPLPRLARVLYSTLHSPQRIKLRSKAVASVVNFRAAQISFTSCVSSSNQLFLALPHLRQVDPTPSLQTG